MQNEFSALARFDPYVDLTLFVGLSVCIIDYLGLDDDDLGGAISEENLAYWLSDFVTNNEDNPFDWEKILHLVDESLNRNYRTPRTTEKLKTVEKDKASVCDHIMETFCTQTVSANRTRLKVTDENGRMQRFDSGIGMESETGACELSEGEFSDDHFSVGDELEDLNIVITPRPYRPVADHHDCDKDKTPNKSCDSGETGLAGGNSENISENTEQQAPKTDLSLICSKQYASPDSMNVNITNHNDEASESQHHTVTAVGNISEETNEILHQEENSPKFIPNGNATYDYRNLKNKNRRYCDHTSETEVDISSSFQRKETPVNSLASECDITRKDTIVTDSQSQTCGDFWHPQSVEQSTNNFQDVCQCKFSHVSVGNFQSARSRNISKDTPNDVGDGLCENMCSMCNKSRTSSISQEKQGISRCDGKFKQSQRVARSDETLGVSQPIGLCTSESITAEFDGGRREDFSPATAASGRSPYCDLKSPDSQLAQVGELGGEDGHSTGQSLPSVCSQDSKDVPSQEKSNASSQEPHPNGVPTGKKSSVLGSRLLL